MADCWCGWQHTGTGGSITPSGAPCHLCYGHGTYSPGEFDPLDRKCPGCGGSGVTQ